MKYIKFCLIILSGCSLEKNIEYPDNIEFFEVTPIEETEPVNSNNDAADDIAIWVNEQNNENSIVIGTDKQYGIYSYDLNGNLIYSNKLGRINNVDIFQKFNFDGQIFPLVVGSNRSDNTIFLGRLFPNGLIKEVIQNDVKSRIKEVYGITTFDSEKEKYIILSGKDGTVEQWEINVDMDDINVNLIRTIKFNSIVEGLVTDLIYRKIYIAEENVGLWEINVDPEADLDKKLILSIDEKYFKSDFEGVTLYEKDDGEGYIIVSIQGSNSFGIIDRKTKKMLSVFRIISNKNIDEVSDTDGIDLAKLSSNKFPKGLFVAQDGYNENQNQNFCFLTAQTENFFKHFLPQNLDTQPRESTTDRYDDEQTIIAHSIACSVCEE